MNDKAMFDHLCAGLRKQTGTDDLKAFFTSPEFVAWMRGQLAKQGRYAPAHLEGEAFWDWVIANAKQSTP